MAKKKRKKSSTTTTKRRRRSSRRTKRRTNSGTPQRRSIPWMQLGVAALAGLGALYAGSKIAETDTFKEFTEGDSKTEALTQVGVGLAGGAAVYYLGKGNANALPAALGVVAGLAGVGAYAYLNDESKSGSSAEVTVSGEGGTAGLGALRRRRMGNAAAPGSNRLPPATSSSSCGCSSSSSSCPMPDDMAAIYDESEFDRC